MTRLWQAIKDDVQFIRGHSLQPEWYKRLKVFILPGVLIGYALAFGLWRMLVFAAVFFLLSLLVHLLYRAKTDRWTRSWLDFVVEEDDGKAKPKRIGVFYYSAVVFNAVVAVIVSQLVR